MSADFEDQEREEFEDKEGNLTLALTAILMLQSNASNWLVIHKLDKNEPGGTLSIMLPITELWEKMVLLTCYQVAVCKRVSLEAGSIIAPFTGWDGDQRRDKLWLSTLLSYPTLDFAFL